MALTLNHEERRVNMEFYKLSHQFAILHLYKHAFQFEESIQNLEGGIRFTLP